METEITKSFDKQTLKSKYSIMENPKFLGQGKWTAYLDNKEEQIPIVANGKAVAFIPPLHEDAIALSILIPTAVNAYSPMLEALKDGHEALSDIINAADNNQPYSADELAKLFIGAYNKIHEAIALAENKK